MKWSIATARKQFSSLVKATTTEPQLIYNRDRLVAAVVDAETYQDFEHWRQHQQATLSEVFAELRQLCHEEHYVFEVPERIDRPNPFASPVDESAV